MVFTSLNMKNKSTASDRSKDDPSAMPVPEASVRTRTPWGQGEDAKRVELEQLRRGIPEKQPMIDHWISQLERTLNCEVTKCILRNHFLGPAQLLLGTPAGREDKRDKSLMVDFIMQAFPNASDQFLQFYLPQRPRDVPHPSDVDPPANCFGPVPGDQGSSTDDTGSASNPYPQTDDYVLDPANWDYDSWLDGF